MPDASAPGGRPPSGAVRPARALHDLRARLVAFGLPRVPRATYRLQFHAGFTFRDAARLVPYLDDLGISDLYASPYLRARSGSTHGYDVADPSTLNPELGSEADFQALGDALAERGMGQLVDVVPNHMGIGDPGNTRWLDVLENGPASRYATFFDINWRPLKAEAADQDKVVLPMLGDQYGQVLERGELALTFDPQRGAFELAYYDHRFPLAPDTYPRVLQPCLDHLEDVLGRRHAQTRELASILFTLRHLPPREPLPHALREERDREKEIVKQRLKALHVSSARFREALEATLHALRGTVGERASFDALDLLIGEQSYRLAFWRVASEEINYRRFFDIHELAAVRMEVPEVFRDTHRLLLRLIGEGTVHGLRIDHPDGLRDPAGYFWRLQRAAFSRLYARRLLAEDADPASLEERLEGLFDRERQRHPRSPLLRSLYVVAEKILTTGEELPADWPIHGTTGYDFANAVSGLFVERSNERLFDTIYSRFIRETPRFPELVNARKKMVMLIALASEVNELAYALKRIAGLDRRFRDFTLNSLTFAIREVIAALPVYRTYVDPASGAMSPMDRAYVEVAVAEARRRNPRTDPSIFDFVRDTLLLQHAAAADPRERAAQLDFVAKFQQTTGPVMAKGVEDTAFYVYNRLVSLNEVGGEPDHFGRTVAQFHRANLARQRRWPATLLATSTHDTKRSEDVRARIDVLSELPREWRAALNRWSRLNGRRRPYVDGRLAPDRNEEYLLYQALLGAWPLDPLDEASRTAFAERIAQFLLKAAREAKVNTSWINPNERYEAALRAFVQAILDPAESEAFLDDFAALCGRVSHVGLFNSLSQTLLKLVAPGVPDLYQGTEVWDFSLVDPDNRRPVDYGLRARLLASLARDTSRRGVDLAAFARQLVDHKEDGRIKLYVTQRTLALRREQPDLFTRGAYVPLQAGGTREATRHVCAFARTAGGPAGPALVAAVPVLVAGLLKSGPRVPLGEEAWGRGWLRVPGRAGQRYRNLLTDEGLEALECTGKAALPLAQVFGSFPVALLVQA